MKDAMFTAFPADPVGTRPGRVYLDDYPFREPPQQSHRPPSFSSRPTAIDKWSTRSATTVHDFLSPKAVLF